MRYSRKAIVIGSCYAIRGAFLMWLVGCAGGGISSMESLDSSTEGVRVATIMDRLGLIGSLLLDIVMGER